jgi:hypothetical protein
MDHSKVNGLNVPPQIPATTAQPMRANELAADRFSRAMGESPSDDSSTTGRSWVRGTRISDLTPEGSQQNREYAYRRLGGSMSEGMMSSVARDVASDSGSGKTRAHIDPAEVAISNSVVLQFAGATHAHANAGLRTASSAELTQMLERMCSALYVGEKSVGTQRVVMTLDHVLPGAAAEIVRDGVHLSIRLHARSEESYRSMMSQRDALTRALSGTGDRRVDVSIVHGDEQALGDGRGGEGHG